jgi:hypothetical protein
MAKYTKAFGLLCLVLPLLVSTLIVAHDELVFSANASAEATENSWASKAPMQQARSSLGVAVVNGKIYSIGGSIESGYQINLRLVVGTNEKYDPESDIWTNKTSMLTPRRGFAIAVYQNKIYCIGGYSTSGRTQVNEVYNSETDTWETKTPLPTPRQGVAANVVNGKIYLAGGSVPDSNSSSGFSDSSLNEVYDPSTDSWTTRAPMPTAANGYASAVVDNKIYFIGGRANNIHQIYNTETDMWSYGASSPSVIFGWSGGGAAAATTGQRAPKRIYVMSAVSTSNQVYDPKTDSWTLGAEMLTERQYLGVAVVNDVLYAIGGLTYHFSLPDDTAGVSVMQYSVNERYTPFGYGSDSTMPTPTSTPVPTPYDYTTPIPYTYSPTPSSSPAPTYGPPPITPTPTVTANPASTPTPTPTVSPTPSLSPSPTQQPTFEPTQSASPTTPPNGTNYSYLIIGTVAVVVVVITIVGLAVYFKLGKKKIAN